MWKFDENPMFYNAGLQQKQNKCDQSSSVWQNITMAKPRYGTHPDLNLVF